MNIGGQITKYRKEKNITQEQLGEAVGVTNRTVSKWESYVSSPGIELIPSIANALGITLDQLFGIEKQQKPKEVSDIIKETIEKTLEEALYNALEDLLPEALEELLPQFLTSNQESEQYSLLVISHDKTSVCRFYGDGGINGPFRLNGGNGDKYGIFVRKKGIDEYVDYYNSKDEAAAALEKIYKAYSQKLRKIEL